MSVQPRRAEILANLLQFPLARGPIIIVAAGMEMQGVASAEKSVRHVRDGVLAQFLRAALWAGDRKSDRRFVHGSIHIDSAQRTRVPRDPI